MSEIIQFNYLNFDIGSHKTGQIKIKCPYCFESRTNKRDKSMSVNLDNGLFKCHCCQKTGNIHKYSFNQIQKKEYVKPVQKPDIKLSQHVVEYFKTRSISLDTLNKVKITSGVRNQNATIEFNYFRNKELINIKTRTKDKEFSLVKDAELIFYNLDSIKDTDSVVITEGEIDCLSYIESGIDFVISVPNGANAGKLEYLNNCISYFIDKTFIYLATDNDTAGIVLRNELLRRFGVEKCYKVDLKDCKDANEFLIKYGKEDLKNTINKNNRFPIEGIVKVEDIKEDIDKMYISGLDKGISIGIKTDELMRWQTGRLCILTGIPSHGKSEFIDIICSLFAINHNFKTCYFSPENYPLELHFSKIAEKIIGKSIENMSAGEFVQAKTYINDNFFFIKPDSEDYTLDKIFEKVRMLIFLYGIKILIIDPWNRLEHQLPKGISETNYISQQLSKMLNFCQNNDILLILSAHPTKLKKQDKSSLFVVPNLYDIAGSAHFYNKADYGITIYRNFETEQVEIHFQKVKFRHLGNIGMVPFKFNINNGRFDEFDSIETFWDNSNWLLKKPEYNKQILIKDITESNEPDY